jgi:arginase
MLKIIKAETSLGSSNAGTELAPAAILKGGLLDALRYNKIDHEILPLLKTKSAIPTKNNLLVKNHSRLTNLNNSIYELAVNNKNPGAKMLLLGGDHSMSIGSMFATKMSHSKAVLIYIDAHPDCNSPHSSPSGNMHGMSLATVLGDSLYDDYDLPKYKYSEVVILGAKDIDPAEREYIDKKKIRIYTMNDIIARGIGDVVSEILKFIKDKPVHVSLDIDSVDVSEAPGTGIVNRGGLSYREIRYATEALSTTDIKSIDLMEVNPKQDEDNKTVNLATELIISLLGSKWSPYEKYLKDHAV